MRHFFLIQIIILGLLAGCIDDSISDNPADQPEFSVDTLKMGEVFRGETSPTARLTVYNPHSRNIVIDRIEIPANDGSMELTVDGMDGNQWMNNIEIRSNDSIYIFVRLTPGETENKGTRNSIRHIDFTTLGVTKKIVVTSIEQSLTNINGLRIKRDTILSSTIPIRIFDSILVEKGTTLTIAPGTRLMFHTPASSLIVYGSLHCNGTPEKNVTLSGDRSGFIAGEIPYDIQPGQWRGVIFADKGSGEISFTTVRNSMEGVVVNGGALYLNCSQISNSTGFCLTGKESRITSSVCEISDGGEGCVRLEGGEASFDHCTFAIYNPFTMGRFGILNLSGDPDIKATNSIFASLTASVINGNENKIMVRNCLFTSPGNNDQQFINCKWDTDPMFLSDVESYMFDYRLAADSPARGITDPSLSTPSSDVDRYGNRESGKGIAGAYYN